ncbi:DUF4468 domain-containing protein [Hymenobacter jejuensis]|uniref:DUF4468 domain-containing protein n=1 Tax=Hymenobacter jejuensis TaxID=2502781 RepID=A0A5B7ZXR2_9BACT|nr:DUF4468 domain-containing protein [Hymenobacter jejuensis]QDA59296.1 DUF4468 domain-containing protein [Hymenobacter jejuensis]
MKVLLILWLVLLGSAASAQQVPYTFSILPLDNATHKVVYTAVVPVAGASKDQLFSRAQEWSAQQVRDYKATELRNNQEVGVVRTRITRKKGQEAYTYAVSVSVKDGFYKYLITNILYTEPDYLRAGKYSTGPTTTSIEKIVYTRPSKYRDQKLTEVDAHAKKIINDLIKNMLHKPTDDLATQW